MMFVKYLLYSFSDIYIQLEDDGVEKMLRLGRWAEEKAHPVACFI